MRFAEAAVVTGCLLSACSTTPHGAISSPPTGHGTELRGFASPGGLKGLAALVAQRRGLAMTGAMPTLTAYDDKQLGELFPSLQDFDSTLTRTVVGSGPMLFALGVGIHSLAEYPTTGLIGGFYDYEANRIGVSTRYQTDFETVAHELGHALLLGHFPPFSETEDVDLKAAELALSEGDTTLLSLSIQPETKRKLTSFLASKEFAVKRDSASEDGNPPDVSEEEMLGRMAAFPYVVGAQFCSFLVRTGGLSRLDAAYRHPAETTEQVLHPRKYLAGELAVPIDTPECPGPSFWIASGRLGELTIQTILLTGNHRNVSARAAEGWGGDAFTVSFSNDKFELRLVTTWDTEEDAIEFERAIRRTSRRWDSAGALSSYFDGPTGTVRDGRNVVVVRGAGCHAERLENGDGVGLESSFVQDLFGLVGSPLPPKPPFEDATPEPALSKHLEPSQQDSPRTAVDEHDTTRARLRRARLE